MYYEVGIDPQKDPIGWFEIRKDIDQTNLEMLKLGLLPDEVIEEIKQFCSMCDYGPNGIDKCPSERSKVRYVGRGWCGGSEIETVRTYTDSNQINIEDELYERTDLAGIKKKIRAIKKNEEHKQMVERLGKTETNLLTKLGDIENGK